MLHTSLTLLFTFSLTSFVNAQNNLISPCPRFFAYEANRKEPGTWYGTLTMLSDFDTYGVYAQISLNKPALQLGNWYSSIFSENNKNYLLVNAKDGLKANVPKKIKIFVKYNTSELPPVIEWIEVNARRICPDNEITETSTKDLNPKSSVQMDFSPKPSRVETTSEKPAGSLTDNAPDASDGDKLYRALINFFTPYLQNETFVQPLPVETISISPAPASSEDKESDKDNLNLVNTLLINETFIEPSPVETTSIKPGLSGKPPPSFENENFYKDDLRLPSPVKTNSNKPAEGLIGQAPVSYVRDGFYNADLKLFTTLLSSQQNLNLQTPLAKNETFVGPSPVETTSIKPGKGFNGKPPASFEDDKFYKDDLHLLSTLIKNENFFGPVKNVQLDFKPKPSPVETNSNKPAGGLIGEAPASSLRDRIYKADLGLSKNETLVRPSPVETTSNKLAGSLIGQAPASYVRDGFSKADLNLLNSLLSNRQDLNVLTPLLKNETFVGPSPVETTSNKPSRGFISQAPGSSEDEDFYKDDLHLLNAFLRTENFLKPTTNVHLDYYLKSSQVDTNSNESAQELIGQTPAAPEDDEFYMGDFYKLFSPLLKDETEKDELSSVNDVCGRVVVPPTPLIAYGQPTNEGEYPWHVAIYHSRGIDWTYICGASLISQDFIITVAHCVAIPRSSKPLNPNNLSIYLGRHYLKRYSNSGIQGRQISEIIIHAQYNPQMFSDDIALLKLAQPAEYTDYVRPICLWQESPNFDSILNKQGKIVGWGFDETGILSDQLMQTEMPVVSQDTCLLSNPQFYFKYTSENTFCAGFRNGTTICNGDSGGGMVFPKSNSNPKNPIWQLRGLISISANAPNKFKCDSSHYVVFMDAAKYLDWIKNKMK